MKKILLIASVVVLVAAACNSKQTAQVNPGANQTQDSTQNQSQSTTQTQIDAAVSGITADVDNEQTVNLQSDEDVIDSDASLIDSYQGAAYEISF